MRHGTRFPGEGAAYGTACVLLWMLAVRLIPGLCVPPLAVPVGGDAGRSVSVPLDVNTASVAQLVSLPGVGPVRARALTAYRRIHGPFRCVDDLVHVPGFGPRTVERIRSMVRCGP